MSAGTVAESSDSQGTLGRNRLGTFDIVFFVVAAAAPLAVVAGGAPLAFRLGGLGAPGAYVFSGVVYILCAAGFTAFARYVRNAGAFYAYISRGLGRPVGAGASIVALISYALICFGFFGFLGFYANSAFADLFGWNVHWSVYAVVGVVLVGALGYRQIDLGARVLGVLMIAEVLILVVLAIAVLLSEGLHVTGEPFAPSNVFNQTSGAMFVLALGAFIGFESTAIYAEEAKDPARTVPNATYLAVAFLALFYGFMTWIAVAALGPAKLVDLSLSDAFQAMYFTLADSYLGGWAKTVMDLLVVTSILAATTAFHNATSRYLFALGRDRLLPAWLSQTHHRHRSPHRASLLVSVGALVLTLVTVVLHGDPYLQLLLWTNGVGILGIVTLQVLCMLAVVRFFRSDRRGHGAFRVVVAPGLAVVGLVIGLWLMVTNLDLLTGRTGWFNVALVGPMVVAGLAAVVWAARMRGREPERYAAIGGMSAEPEEVGVER